MPVYYRNWNINEISTIRCKFSNFDGAFPILTPQTSILCRNWGAEIKQKSLKAFDFQRFSKFSGLLK